MLVAMINWWIIKKKRMAIAGEEVAYSPVLDFSDARNSQYLAWW